MPPRPQYSVQSNEVSQMNVDRTFELAQLKSQLSDAQLKQAKTAYHEVLKTFHAHHCEPTFSQQNLINDIKIFIIRNTLSKEF